MTRLATTALAAALLLVLGAAVDPARADFTNTIAADTTMAGNTGFIFRTTEVGYPTDDAFVFVEGTMYRVYAVRTAGDVWTVLPTAQYYAPTTTMSVGQSWNGIQDDFGQLTTATVTAFESVTVPAGTFMCYRVDVTVTGDTFVFDTYWLASGVGLVRESFWDGFEWSTDELLNYSVVGTGIFPRTVGNTWNYSSMAVPVEETTWGQVKALFR